MGHITHTHTHAHTHTHTRTHTHTHAHTLTRKHTHTHAQATGERLKEAKSINMSLSALGDVISALSTGEKFVPYRNNLLTRLLQDGLGGNAKTLMFVNISPADYNSEETCTSLQYAQRVKMITNDAAKASESAEVAKLKGVISDLKKGKKVEEKEEKEGGDKQAEEPPAQETDVDDDAWMEGPAFERQARLEADAADAAEVAGSGDGELGEGEGGGIASKTRTGSLKPLPK